MHFRGPQDLAHVLRQELHRLAGELQDLLPVAMLAGEAGGLTPVEGGHVLRQGAPRQHRKGPFDPFIADLVIVADMQGVEHPDPEKSSAQRRTLDQIGRAHV